MRAGDERVRALERAALLGDEDAAAALARERARRSSVGEPRFPAYLELRERQVDLLAPTSLEPGLRRLLAEELAPLGELAEEAVRFVTHGDHAGILDSLGPDASAALAQSRSAGAPRPLLESLRAAPALLRLGLLFAACETAEVSTVPEERSWPPLQARRYGEGRAPRWLTLLLREGSVFLREAGVYGGYPGSGRWEGALSVATLAELLAFAQEDPLALPRLILTPHGSEGPWRFDHRDLAAQISPEGQREFLEDFPEEVRAHLTRGHANARLRVFEVLRACGGPFAGVWGPIARLAGLRSSYERGAIQSFLYQEAERPGALREIRAGIEEALREGSAEERANLVPFYAELCGRSARPTLERLRARDRSPRARERAAAALAAFDDPGGDAVRDLGLLPAPSAAAERAFRAAFRGYPELDPAWEHLIDPEPWGRPPPPLLAAELLAETVAERLVEFVTEPSVTLGHVLRALRLVTPLEDWEQDFQIRQRLELLEVSARGWFESRGLTPDLEQLALAWAYLGLDERTLGRIGCCAEALNRWLSCADGWAGAEFYARHPEAVIHGLTGVRSGIEAWRRSILSEVEAIADQLGEIPQPLRRPLLDLALAEAKSSQASGQRALRRAGDWLCEELQRELGARRAGRALSATRWLRERAEDVPARAAAAIEALEERLPREQRVKVKAALSEALDALRPRSQPRAPRPGAARERAGQPKGSRKGSPKGPRRRLRR